MSDPYDVTVSTEAFGASKLGGVDEASMSVVPSVNNRPLSAAATLDADVLDAIAQRVLWIATAMIDAANRG